MSPWRRSVLQVELAPGRVKLVGCERRLTLRGWRDRLCEQALARVAAEAADEPWRGAVEALAGALAGLDPRPACAQVILSSHLVRYALVPWSDALSDEAEELAFARHGFTRIYGEAAAQWVLRVSPGGNRAPLLASAIDAPLFEALQEAFAGAGVRLDSVQPNLMTVYNDYRRRLRGGNGWLAVVEPGTLCLALFHQGRWARIRSLRTGPGWREELPLILERETYLADPATASREVYLWAPGLREVPKDGRWQFHLLVAGGGGCSTPADETRFALAMEG